MKIFKTFFILLICIIIFCQNVFCSDLLRTPVNDLKPSKNTEKFLETSLKRYTVYQYKKDKILCEPYRVSKDDWLYKIFRKKGELSEKDFPLFINIFKAFNPGINDIDAIHPGQTILIPLKKIHKNDFKETSPGVVDVPIIEFVSASQALQHVIKRHRIKKGETLSQLLDPVFLNKDGTINARGMRALKLSDPNIKNINRIYAGSFINLPTASVNSPPDVTSSKPIKKKKENKIIKKAKNKITYKGHKTGPDSDPALSGKSKLFTNHGVKPPDSKPALNHKVFQIKRTLSKVLKDYASAMGGKLIRTGKFYFPETNRSDLVLDLKSHPVIELADGGKIVIVPHRNDIGSLSQSIGGFWKNLKIITLAQAVDHLKKTTYKNDRTQFKGQMPGSNKKSRRDSTEKKKLIYEQSFKNNMEQEKLPIDHEAALKRIIGFTNFHYLPNSQISLSFNNININVTLGKIQSKKGPDLLVDFGTIYGYALDMIREKGIHIVSFPPKNHFKTSLAKLFTELGMSAIMNPVFISNKTQSAITINGLYITGNLRNMLITTQKPDDETTAFLNQKNIKILLYTQSNLSEENK